ncbi:MAG: S1C family serine protease, partial [Thermoleophilaceae bacterium]
EAAPPPPRPAPARRSPLAGRARKLAAGGVLVGVLGVAFATGVLIGSDDGPEPLPAVSDGQVKPRSGQAPAGNVFAAASPGVVSVRTDSGAGTGFLIDSGGTLVTNAHVVGGSERVSVRFGESEPLEAKVLGTDPSSDLAVLRADAGDLPASAKPLQFADSRNVHVGDAALAIGNPFGLDRTATAGIVSGLGRSIESPNGFSIDEVIQTDAPINPGNSGGPLLDSSARVIGVNSQIATSGASGNVGIGFAVPSNTVREVVPRLQRGEQIERAYLGLESSPAPPTGPSGAEVQTVIPGTPADRAGLEEGDIVTQVAGKTVHDPSDVSAAIADKQPGDGTLILVRRAGTTVALNATLGDRPAQTP